MELALTYSQLAKLVEIDEYGRILQKSTTCCYIKREEMWWSEVLANVDSELTKQTDYVYMGNH